MDEIEYKLNTKNSVLIVNAIDKLIYTIKSKYKVGERQKFVLENEELKFLRDKCSSKDATVSLTACQGLLALVELGVLEIGHTMSTVITLLPSACNHSAIISTMAGLLILDLKSRLVPGQPYKCQFTLKSPKHPFITVLEKNKDAEEDVLVQMNALCTHPDYIVSSNSLELLPVFLWLTCNPQHSSGIRPWQLLLSLPQSTAQSTLLLACLSCQQVCNSNLIERAFGAYSVVTDAAVYRQHVDYVTALLPMLARISNELIKHGRDPRSCYTLIERCFALEAPELRNVAGLVISLLAENLVNSSALHLHELFNLCLNIISKFEYSTLSLNIFVAFSLQWLNLPSYLTSAALKVASKILDIYQNKTSEDSRLHMPNLKANKIFQSLLYTDRHLSVMFKVNEIWERVRDNPDKLKSWFDSIESADGNFKFELLPFLIGVCMQKGEIEDVVLRALRIVIGLVEVRKEVSVLLLPVLMYKIANDRSPHVKLECLRALPKLAKYKENVPAVVSILNKLKAGKGVPTSFLIMLYASLAETQVRCFPYLQEMLVETGMGRPDDLKWEVEIAKAIAVERICEIRPSSHGLELVSTISSLLNRSSDRSGAVAAARALSALARLWRGAAVAPPGAWRALEPKLGRDSRPLLQVSLCKLLSEVPALRVQTPEYDKLITDATRKLWNYIAESNHPEVVEAACDALAAYKIEDYKLKDIPEIYRRTVKLPASYCKTPADAARKPEDVLDYVPCEVWPEVYKCSNSAALGGVQRLVRALLQREIRGFRGGVYQLCGRPEPPLPSLPPTSALRGLLECFRRQVTSPSYEFPDAVLLSILQTLAEEYPKPLPPFDLCFVYEAFHRGTLWRAGCVKLAARQAQTSPSARRFLENYMQGIGQGTSEESDIMQIFEILPILCRGMPPNTLRTPIERSLSDSFSAISKVKNKGTEEDDAIFVKQLAMIQQCLECDKIHDANRTLLSQIVEHYFSVLSDDNVAWPAYVECCGPLSCKYLERMTSPSGWWEAPPALLRKAAAVRCLAATLGAASPLLWLNELVDAQAGDVTGQEFSLQCMIPALKAAKPDEPSTKEWFMQLMARTQVAFNETEDQSAKLYLCDVFILSVVVFCGHWALSPDAVQHLTASSRRALLPAACAALLAREAWTDCTLHMLEWLYHTRDSIGEAETAMWCQRALLALRHTEHFAHHKVWTRLESHFGKNAIAVDI
ncbi:LOW QUALITY PROTEIN: focadhesin [Aphomia sociella]